MRKFTLCLLLCASQALAQDRLVNITPFDQPGLVKPADKQMPAKTPSGSRPAEGKFAPATTVPTLPLDNPLLAPAGSSARGLQPVGDLNVYRTMEQARLALEKRALAGSEAPRNEIAVAARTPPWWVTHRLELAASVGAVVLLLAFWLWRRA